MRHRRGEEHELRIFCNHFCDRYAAASLLVLPCKLNLAPELLGFLVSLQAASLPEKRAHCPGWSHRSRGLVSRSGSVPASSASESMQPCVRHLNERQTRVGEAKKPQLLPFCLSLRAANSHSIAGGVCAVQKDALSAPCRLQLSQNQQPSARVKKDG